MRYPIFLLCLSCAASPAAAQGAPWLITDARANLDNQQRTALRTALEYGRWLTPATTGGVSLAVEQLAGDDVASSTTFEPGLHGSLGIAALRTGIRAGLRALVGTDETTSLGFAELSVSLPRDIALRGRAYRDRYTATLAAIDTTVIVQRREVVIDRAAAPGWAWELLARSDSYGDDNPVTTAYGWLLAPLSRSARHGVRVGYSIARQDTDESRWRPDAVQRGRGRGRGNSADSIPGRYDPYHTPHDAVTHTVLGEVAVLVGAMWLRGDVGYGVHATDLAPTLQRSSPTDQFPTVAFYERSFTPYSLRLTAFAPVGAASSITLSLHHEKTAFYRDSGARLTLARTLGGS